jgi:hypothetical protein
MSTIDFTKVNAILQEPGFGEELRSDLSDEGIIKAFKKHGVELSQKDAQSFKSLVATQYQKLSDESVNAAGGIAAEGGARNVGKAMGEVLGGAVGGMVDVGVSLGKGALGAGKGLLKAATSVSCGIGHAGWEALKFPVGVVHAIGEGVLEGIRDSL